MRVRIGTIMIIALLCLAPSAAMCDLAPYSQDFEGLLASENDQPDQVSLANDGWKVFVNVFGPDWWYWYGYGTFPAPNGGFGGPAFSAVVIGEGGAEQGAQQLVVFSDYNNGNHRDGSGANIETNVFQEQTIGAADIGDTWTFRFDAKRGNLEGGSAAYAFFKTIGANFNYYPVDMTNIPDSWNTYSVSITITPELEGHILQFGFLNYASNSEGSGMFYDNVSLSKPVAVGLDLRPGGCPNPINSRSQGDFPAAVLGSADFDVSNIDFTSLRLEGVPALRSDYEDVSTPFGGDLCGCNEAGGDGYMDMTLKFDTAALLVALGPGWGGDRILTLTGNLLDGTPIEGMDCVLLVGGGGASGLQSEASAGSTGGMDLSTNGNVQTDTSMSPTDTGEARTREGKDARRTVRPLRDRME